jgi:hypothetical protein
VPARYGGRHEAGTSRDYRFDCRRIGCLGGRRTLVWEGGGAAYPGQDGPSSSSKVTGEAVVVELGSGKFLFALLSGSHGLKGAAANIASFAYWGADKAAGTDAGLRFLTNLPIGTSAVLDSGNYPLLVTFSNVNDPSTVQTVDPANLDANFGKGWALNSISIEITADAISKGKLRGISSWLNELRGSIGKDMNLPYDHLLNQINDGSFSQGRIK